MSDSIEAKKKSRKVLRCSFTKTANELEILLKAVPLPRSNIAVLLECLRLKYGELSAVDQVIYIHLLEIDATEEILLDEMDQNDGYQRRFVDLKLQSEKPIEQPLEVLEDRSTDGRRGEFANGHSKGKRKFQLPTTQFKLFEGNIRDWLGFWSQFKKIHEDMDIDACDKIQYLIQATVDGSRARRIVESFPSIGGNYEKIIECLKARFGREDLQIEVYVRELLKLVLNRTLLSPSKNDLAHLYDQIETQLRALDTLGINSDRYAALLLPLIESCLPLDLMRIWQRSRFNIGQDTFSDAGSQSEEFSVEGRLSNLMRFLRSEVENELRVDLACAGFGLAENIEKRSNSERKNVRNSETKKTAAALIHGDVEKCIFCSGTHESQSCFKAQKMSFEERKHLLSNKKACFRCLKIGHQSRKCRMRLRCIICGFSHVPLMCQIFSNKQNDGKSSEERVEPEKNHAMTNQSLSRHVFLQTLRMSLKAVNGIRSVRGLIDSGSQRSYILKSTANALNLKPKRIEKITHCLFGGTQVVNTHYCYDITIVKGQNKLTFEVLDQACICNDVATVFYGPWMQELQIAGIDVSDRHESGPIELLFGADIAGSLYTGKRNTLKNGLVAYETLFGWTVEGKVTTVSMLANPSITELWQLDVLGISDPKERKSREELELAAQKLFNETVEFNREGRYEVRLPWLEDHPALPSNLEIARKRLSSTLKKLEMEQLTIRYNEAFEEWKSMGIIEEIRKLAPSEKWHHIPGSQNPADLPSRGCSPTQLMRSKWWEGPDWLYRSREVWCKLILTKRRFLKKRRKREYPKTMRMMAWIFRFAHKSKCHVVACSMKNKQRLRENLRQRFRIEYLGQLKLTKDNKSSATVKLGQIVLIGMILANALIGFSVELSRSFAGKMAEQELCECGRLVANCCDQCGDCIHSSMTRVLFEKKKLMVRKRIWS